MSAEIEKQGRRRRRNKDEEEVMDETEERNVTAKKGRATVGRRNADEVTSQGFVGRIAEYLNGVRSELDKVTWPSREDTIRLTRIVLLVTVAAALILGLISFALTELFVIGLRQPIIFVILAVVVAAIYFGYTRWNRNRSVDTTFSSRL